MDIGPTAHIYYILFDILGSNIKQNRRNADWRLLQPITIPRPPSILLSAVIGMKLIGPYGGLQVDEQLIGRDSL